MEAPPSPDDAPAPTAPPDPGDSRPSRPRRVGRRAAQALYFALLAGIAVTATVQITQQVFFPSKPAGAPPFETCQEGLRALHSAVENGRRAAEPPPSQLEAWDGETAVLKFRQAVQPIWMHRAAVVNLCQSTPAELPTLDALERLRYAEEHNVRRQTAELAGLRHRVRTLVEQGQSPDP